MKRFNWFVWLTWMFFFLSMGLTTGCSKKQEVEQAEEIRPVKTLVVKAPDTGGIRNFPGRVDANRKAQLAFRVAGKVQELLVKEGDEVSEGDVIAKLDATDFQISVNDKQALFTRAKNDFNRGEDLIKDGNISKMDFDKLEANYLSAKADLNLAEQQLAYTELKAPFAGTVAKRYIQSFEEVQAKQDIIALNDNEILEIKLDVPENLILNIRGIDKDRRKPRASEIPVTATFQSDRDKEYPLELKEAATKADANTQTFSITYTMPKPDNVIILPGMSTSVKMDLTKFMAAQKDLFYLPVSAVVADVKLQGTVWVVNEASMEVEPASVKVGVMKGNQIQVLEGLQEGQHVVIAGVPFLYKGLKVTLMKNSEQARDNLKHEQPVMKQDNKNTPEEG